ncbi:MAG: nitroreductase [Oscillospiraceae bacterium]|nr:nitroreductase [Oscillospiraceae bacterium]
MELKDCILTRRSVRKFLDKPVDRETLEQIIATAAYAPSWKNTQISRYIAIEDRDMLDTICRDFLPGHNANIVSGAPLLIAQTFVKNRCGFERDGSFSTQRKDGWQHFDCGIAAQTFCLAAHDAGLGTVIIGNFPHKELGAFLNVPEDQELMALIAVGYPAEEPVAPKRKDVDTLLKYI